MQALTRMLPAGYASRTWTSLTDAPLEASRTSKKGPVRFPSAGPADADPTSTSTTEGKRFPYT